MTRKLSQEQISKIYVSIGIVIVSLYLAVTVHEYGHAMFYSFYGCKESMVLINPLIVFSTADCINPSSEEFFKSLTSSQTVIVDLGGITVQFILGIFFLYLFFYINPIKKNYVLSLFSFFFSLTNFGHLSMYLAFDPFSSIGDIIDIIKITGIDGILVSFLGLILIVSFLAFYTKKFSMLLKRVEPKLNEKQIKKFTKIFLISLIALILLFGMFFILY